MAELSRELWIVGFFLSKYGNNIKGRQTAPPTEFKTSGWQDTYDLFYDKFGEGKSKKTFRNSLKNCRDAYDGHTNTSGRAGWRDINRKPVKLLPTSRSVFNRYDSQSREKIWSEIKQFISPGTTSNRENKPIEQRKSNPDWTREELILALDLYYDLDQGQMHKGHPSVIRVSNELRALKIHPYIPDLEKFRNPSGVSRRLGNFKTMDSGYVGDGLPNSGKLAKEIFKEFVNHRDKLRKEAMIIRQLYLKSQPEKASIATEPKVNYTSEFLFQFHKNRETDPLIIRIKKEIVLKESKTLKCEVCKFDSLAFYGEVGNDLMEIHYKKEFKNDLEFETSDLNDFIVVCSNCHKVLDKNFGLLDPADVKKLIRKR